jgi:CRISPR system Cascade subunit CasD
MRILLLRLEGPLMSFGDVAIDERMPVGRFPALSMITGLLANAMGLDRAEPGPIQALQDGMRIASRIDRGGHLLQEYQTAGLNSADKMWTSRGVVAGRDGGASGDFTVQLYKEFWSDASVTVAVELPPDVVDTVAAALRAPARPLFLGRASCPPSRPILLDVIEATDLLDALRRAPRDVDDVEMAVQSPGPVGLAASHERQVSDIKDWANGIHRGVRKVHEGRISVGEVS